MTENVEILLESQAETGDLENVFLYTELKRRKVDASNRRKHFSHEYFLYDPNKDASLCQIQISSSKACNESISGKNPTSLLCHLNSKHPILRSELADKKRNWDSRCKASSELRKRGADESQVRMDQCFPKLVTKTESKGIYLIFMHFVIDVTINLCSGSYHDNCSKRMKLDKLLAVALATTNISYDVVERDEFRELINALDPRYPVPSRRTVCRRVNMIYDEMIELLKVCITISTVR